MLRPVPSTASVLVLAWVAPGRAACGRVHPAAGKCAFATRLSVFTAACPESSRRESCRRAQGVTLHLPSPWRWRNGPGVFFLFRGTPLVRLPVAPVGSLSAEPSWGLPIYPPPLAQTLAMPILGAPVGGPEMEHGDRRNKGAPRAGTAGAGVCAYLHRLITGLQAVSPDRLRRARLRGVAVLRLHTNAQSRAQGAQQGGLAGRQVATVCAVVSALRPSCQQRAGLQRGRPPTRGGDERWAAHRARRCRAPGSVRGQRTAASDLDAAARGEAGFVKRSAAS